MARLPRVWALLTVCAGLLSLAGVVVGLLAPGSVDAGNTSVLVDTATAQDLTGLAVGPALVLLAVRARRGDQLCWLVLLGVLAFTAYNYAIYAFSLSFGPLFLLGVATWGLSVFALVGAAATLPWSAVNLRAAGATAPLHLEATTLAPDRGPGPVAHGYEGGQDVTGADITWVWALGGITTSGPDLGEFLDAAFGGGIATADLATTTTTSGVERGPEPGDPAYLLGLARDQLSCGPAWGQDSRPPATSPRSGGRSPADRSSF
ncbi:MAG: hypothetical protein ABIS35_10755 [Terracoccus sp.]